MPERFTTHVKSLPDAPWWLNTGLAAILYPLIVLSIFIYWPFYTFMMRKEGGIEFVTVAFLIVGVGYGVVMLARYRQHLPRPWLTKWFALAILGMFLFAGEELSWGQHLGFWTEESVPESIKAINDQNETNLHNISNLLDQGVTNVIVAMTFVAFVALPLYLWRRGETMGVDNPGYWFWPTRAGLVAALGVLIIPFPKRIYEWAGGTEVTTAWRHSELHECYVALLMMIYIISVHHRLRGLARRAPSPAIRALSNGSAIAK
jgi:hypothetical protein